MNYALLCMERLASIKDGDERCAEDENSGERSAMSGAASYLVFGVGAINARA